jgi:hypothetical protein
MAGSVAGGIHWFRFSNQIVAMCVILPFSSLGFDAFFAAKYSSVL